MSHISFVVCNQTSALISALTFAKALVTYGHQVTVMGNENSCEKAAKLGLKVASYGTFLERSAPTGLAVAFHDKFTRWFPPPPSYLEEQNEICSALTRFQQRETFDLALVDTMISYPFMLGSLRAGVPVARFSPNLGSTESEKYPAISSSVIPSSKKFLFNMQCRISWLHRKSCVLPPMLTSRWTSLGLSENLHQSWRKEIKLYNINLRSFEYGITAENVPELVAAPVALEFPSLVNTRKNRTYIGACVDPTRDIADNDYLDREDNRPLIYCAMGTFSKRYSHAQTVFETVIQYALTKKDYRFLIQYGDVELNTGRLPDHIRIQRFVPQIKALRKASAMISHGGLGSVREASFFGVPMIIIPGWNDQYGNAARVQLHGTGVRLHPRHLTVHSLDKLISMLQTDPLILKNVSRMQNAFREQESCEPGLRAIDEIINQVRISCKNRIIHK
ncbi:MAG: hypothetical protein GKR95_14220 [Gammaproteobacteria bacterium]|nr:hypothetical protein [Gammaproteobacteria bacterium]